MKSNLITLILIPLLVTVIVTGCGDDDDKGTNGGGGVPSDLVGTWTFQSATVDGQTEPLGEILDWVEGAVSATVTITSSGSYTYLELGSQGETLWTGAGTASVSGSTLTLRVTEENGQAISEPEILSGTYSLIENQLTLTANMEDGGEVYTVVLTLTKS